MKYAGVCALTVSIMCGAALATDVNMWIEIDTECYDFGDTVAYTVYAELSDDANEGLALIGFDLEFAGGALPQADEPTQDPALNFAIGTTNAGINNPAGYGGTVIDGKLIQVGGGQNTIKNVASNAPFPIGDVFTGVGAVGSPFAAVSGTLTYPDSPGSYQLLISNVFANVIKDGETGAVFWATEAAGVGEIMGIEVPHRPCGTVAYDCTPGMDENLWRSANNHIVCEPIDLAPMPTAGDIMVRELLAGGAYGPDLAVDFTFASDADAFSLTENGSVLSNGTWYGVSIGGAMVHLCVQMGDANNDGRVLPNDLSLINTAIPTFLAEPTDRRDINGDSRLLPNDLSLANTAVPTLSRPAKPAGH